MDSLKNNCSNYVNNLLNSYYTYEGKTVETKFVINTINYDFVIYSGNFINDSYILNLNNNKKEIFNNNFISQVCNKLQNEIITKIIKYLIFTNVNDIDVNKIYKIINNELIVNNNWTRKNDYLYKIVYTQPNTKHLDPLLFKHQLLPYMAHTTEFPQTQNFTKCVEILIETTNKYTSEDIRPDERDLNTLEFNNIPQDTLKLYNYCGQNVKEWIDKTNKNISVIYFSKNKYDILNYNQINKIDINKKSAHKITKTIKFYIIKYGEEGEDEDKPITNYTGDVKLFLDNNDTIIKEIRIENEIVYNGCDYIFKNLISDKLAKYYDDIDEIIFPELSVKTSNDYKNFDNKLEAVLEDYIEILDNKFDEIRETMNDIYLQYFNEYIFSNFNFHKLIDYKNLVKVNEYITSISKS